ncbi:hypothetical protein BGZ54_003614 [Gamsiella multidivaricata]|nr:hypothetical protein BGZ54_003614 [Gamsiella multidivaricata]
MPHLMSDNHQDPIAPHSDTLSQFFNQQHPETVLVMARSFSKKNVVSAAVVQVHRDGFVIEGQTAQAGPTLQVSVSFSSPALSLVMAKEAFLRIGKQAEAEAEAERGSVVRRQIPGQPPGLGVYWPHWSPFLIALAISVSSFFVVYFFPNVSIPPFVWIKQIWGLDTVRTCVHFAVFLHGFQLVTAWYLMKRVAKCPFSIKQVLIWSVCVQIMGIGSMLKLLPIVYNSKFVSDEIEAEEKELRQRQQQQEEEEC